MRAILIFWK